MTNSPLTILYDGWSLVRTPTSPAALHLLAILAYLPGEVQPVVALPGPVSDWLKGYTSLTAPTADTAQGKLVWEQRHLPRIAHEHNASLIHFQNMTSPLFGKGVSVVSPSESQESNRFGEHSFVGRLLASMQKGGLTRTRAVLWPEGLPAPGLPEQLLARLPQVVHPAFLAALEFAESGKDGAKNKEQSFLALNLPETYVLYHGPGQAGQIDRLLKAWSWAAGAIGEYYPLLVLGLNDPARQQLASLAAQYDLEDSVRALPEVFPSQVPALYQGCSALFHPAPVPAWGGAVQHALASGKPVVGSEGEIMNALVGPAAYLAPAEDARALGAALLTVIVEEPFAEKLSATAQQRVSSWSGEKFGEKLLEAYRGLLERA